MYDVLSKSVVELRHIISSMLLFQLWWCFKNYSQNKSLKIKENLLNQLHLPWLLLVRSSLLFQQFQVDGGKGSIDPKVSDVIQKVNSEFW